MNLQVYLAVNDMTVRAFAEKLDVAPGYISAIKCGRNVPGRKLARKIKELTNGEIVFEQNKSEQAA